MKLRSSRDTILPEVACLQAQEHNFQFVVDTSEEDEDWEDVLEDMEDIWMREPAGM